MFEGTTPASEPTPFAVGYGNGYGYESAPASAIAADVAPRWGEGAATMAMPAVDPDATQVIPVPTPVSASAPAPFTARPVGAAHPRRRFGRGLVLAGLALVVTGTGIGALALGTPAEIRPAAAVAASPGGPAAVATADAAGNLIGRGVDPTPAPGAGPSLPPVSIIEPTVLTRPTTSAPTTTAPPTTEAPATVPPTTPPTTTAPPATSPPMTTSPETGPTFTGLSVPTTVSCPSPYADAYASFSWTAPGASKVTLSIDGPGIYRSYVGPSGSETVFFPCSSAHTYLFTAYGADGSTTLRSFTVSPA